jgi:plasmid stabilization system protein ParE
MIVKISAEAAEEMADAATWYDQRKPGLGMEFMQACDRAFQTISENPERYLEVGKGFRRFLVSRFTYIVFFERQGTLLIIAAVIHGSR